jgi:FkbM family methyltransferase
MWRENVQIIQACHLAGGIRKVGEMYLPASDQMFVRSFQNGQIFDQLSFYTAMKYCKRRGVAIDGGAHVGSWTKALENKFEKVIAFEPSKDNFKCLKRNVSADIHRKALGEKAKRISIEKTDPRNTGQDHVVEGNEVDMIAIDSLNLDELDFLKLDVEGYEYFALEGAKNTLEKCKPVVLIEVNGLSARYGIDDTYADKFLKDIGYRQLDQSNKDFIYGPA